MKSHFPDIHCVIFDCDGVLVDSEVLANQTALDMLRPYGFEMSQAEYGGSFAGKTEENILAIVRDEYGIALPDDFLVQMQTAIAQRLDRDLQPIPGMRAVIASLPVPTAVVSNSSLERVKISLSTAQLSNFFGDRLFAAEMVDRPKPAPDVYQYAARQLGFAPEHCLVVEDSHSGVTAASEAGMIVIGFLAAGHIPAGHERTLRTAGATKVVPDASALQQTIDTFLKQ